MPRVHMPDGRIVNFPDGMGEADIAKAMQDIAAPAGASATPAAPTGDLGRFGGYKMIGDAVLRMGKAALQHPIETGALAGGAIAAPLTGGASFLPAMAAAGLGGAGGAGLGMIVNALTGSEASPTTAGGVLTRMGTEGAQQAALEGGGRAVQGGLKAVASQMYRGALRPGVAIRAKYPNVIEQGLSDAAIVGPKSSVPKMRGLVKSSRAQADQMVADVGRGRGGVEIPAGEVTKDLSGIAETSDATARAAGTASESARVAERAGKIQAPSLEEAHANARLLNDKADPAFRAAQRGGAPVSLDSQIDRALAGGYSNAVKSRVPGLADQNAITSTRYGLAKALQAAAERPSVLGNLMAGGTGIGTFYGTGDVNAALKSSLAMKALFSPRALSVGAIGLNRLGGAPVANALRTVLLSNLVGKQDED